MTTLTRQTPAAVRSEALTALSVDAVALASPLAGNLARRASRLAPAQLGQALSALPGDVAFAVREAAAALGRARVGSFALCGDVAVSAYATPRATDRVAFLVDDTAFYREGSLLMLKPGVPVRVGNVVVDLVSLRPGFSALADALAQSECSDGVPVLSAGALVVMKLLTNRLRDQADVLALLASGAVDVVATRAQIARDFREAAPGGREFPDLLQAFDAQLRDAAGGAE